ncbi:MAG: hypothetical protein JNL67_21430 [Planctomycetaceae bacterium]|nr:hypothetical protein [Planctomycetaceae bacterium]
MKIGTNVVHIMVIGSFAMAAATFLFYAFLLNIFVVNAIPISVINQIQPGQTMHEVVLKLGQPSKREGEQRWYYSVAGANDYFCVEFDDDDRVRWLSF